MARSPIEITPDQIPFSEGAPADDLQVENYGDNDVLIGDPTTDMIETPVMDFHSNLAETINQRELDKKASVLVKYYEADKESRSDWEERYKKGLMTLDPEGGLDES